MDIHPLWRAQIALLKADEAFISILPKYINFADIFLKDLVAKLLEATKINDHSIDLIKGQQPPYRSIYSLGLVKLETLKIHIKTNLVNSFIRPSKSSVGAFILFVKKPNRNLQLYINYKGLNNLTIMNRYPLFLISKSLD